MSYIYTRESLLDIVYPIELLIFLANCVRCIDVATTGPDCTASNENSQSAPMVSNHRQCITRQYRIRGPTHKQDMDRRETHGQNAQNLRKRPLA